MKSLKILFSILLVVFSFVGCKDDSNSFDDMSSQITRIAVSLDNASDTRVDVVGSSVRWNDEDYIYLLEVGESGFSSVLKFEIDPESISTNGKSAEFICDESGLTEGRSYVAIYGDGELLGSRYRVKHDYDKIIMQSNNFVASATNSPQIIFSHQCAILHLDCTLDGECDYGELESVTISASTNESIFASTIYTTADGKNIFDGLSSALTFSLDGIQLESGKRFELSYPIVWNNAITNLDGEFTFTLKTTNGTVSTTRPMKRLSRGVRYNTTLNFEGFGGDMSTPDDELTDREILELFYKATRGDSWIKRDNWCSEEQLSSWYGVKTDDKGNVVEIILNNNSLSGSLPKEMGELEHLSSFIVPYNSLTGEAPEWLEEVDFINIAFNKLSGTLPSGLYSSQEEWNQTAWQILPQQAGYSFDKDYADVEIIDSRIETLDGKSMTTHEVFGANKLTCLVCWSYHCGFSELFNAKLREIYDLYKDHGFGVLSFAGPDSGVVEYVNNNHFPWSVVDHNIYKIPYISFYYYPSVNLIDPKGRVIFSTTLSSTPQREINDQAFDFIEAYLGHIDPDDQYQSIDFSADGRYSQLQAASEGDGIDVVIMGDGFVDLDMGDGGLYESRMRETMDALFSEEPFKTLRDRFNIYYINVVSKNRGIGEGIETALDVWLGDDTLIGGDDSKCLEYARKIPSIAANSDNLLVIIAANSDRFAGTCYMQGQYNGLESQTTSFAYCPYPDNDAQIYRQVVTHEAGGHGFGLLMDEYYSDGTTIDERAKSDYKFKYDAMGWGENVDITDDPSQIHWADMLVEDSPYRSLVGIYEGAMTYNYGAYRPQNENSIMIYNTGGFNPPSRRAIYRRIMELSGAEYRYEDFVDYDAQNRTKEAIARSAAQTKAVDKGRFVPLAPPVLYINDKRISN